MAEPPFSVASAALQVPILAGCVDHVKLLIACMYTGTRAESWRCRPLSDKWLSAKVSAEPEFAGEKVEWLQGSFSPSTQILPQQ